MAEIKTYKDILVSSVDFDFTRNAVEAVPHQLYAEWAALVIEITKAIYPAFEAPPFPTSLEWTDDSLPSDGPYPSSENYYMYDVSYVQLKGENDYGIEISIESGRQDRGSNVNINSLGSSYGVSSFIFLNSPSPLATFFIFPAPEQNPAIEAIFAKHREKCLSNATQKKPP